MNTRLTSISRSRTESTQRTSERGLALFFIITLGWMGICGGGAILVARGTLTLPLAPLALISVAG
ncbi:MAG: hypothetical protein R2911_44125 [Caldilineaceae bacterium]